MKAILYSRFLRRWLSAALFAAVTFGGFLKANIPLDEVAIDPVALSENTAIEEAVFLATSAVENFATTDPEGFAAVLRQSFGSRLSPEMEQQFLEQAASRQLPLPVRFVIVPNMILEGASAAYMSKEGGAILLAAEFRASAPALATLILHEWGHHLDTLLGRGDSALDEGDLFFHGINRGEPLPSDIICVVAAGADDHGIIEFEGQRVEVEFGFFDAIGSALVSVGKGIVSVGKAAVNTVVNVAKKAVAVVKNTVKAAVNTVKGAAMGIASGLAHMTGNSRLGDSLAKGARGSFGNVSKSVLKVGSDAIGAAADAGDLINKTSAELDKIAPGLGTIGSLAVSFTPAGPAVALLKGIADVKNVVDSGGSTGAIFGAVGFAALDFGGSRLGRFTGGLSAAKAGATGAKGVGKLVRTGASSALLGKASKWPRTAKVWGAFKGGLAKGLAKAKDTSLAKGLAKLKKLGDAGKASTLKSWKLTRANAAEIAAGGKFAARWPKGAKALEILQKGNKFTQPKFFIPGRERTADGVLLGTGGNQWKQFEKKGGDFFGGGDLGSGGGSLEYKNRSTGTVKSFNAAKGFGFITPDDGGKDLFVHHSEIQSSGYASLDKGQKVDFEISEGKKGPSATDVRALLTNTDSGTKTGQALASVSGRVTGTDEKGNYLGIVPNAAVEIYPEDLGVEKRSLNRRTAKTNETGYYEVSGLQPGHYTFYVEADGYASDRSQRGLVIPAKPTDGYVVGFILTQDDFFSPIKSGIMAGHAWEEKNGKRTPMVGVKVVAKLESGGYGYREGITDKNGNYSFDVAPGMWKASATPRGKDSKTYPGIVTVKEKVTTKADFVFTESDERAPPVAGAVNALVSIPNDWQSRPPVVSFVNVATGKVHSGKLRDASPENISFKTSKGRFFHEASPSEPLKVGRYRAEVKYQGYGSVKSVEKTLAVGQTTWFDLVFGPGYTPADDPVVPITPKTPVTPPAPLVKPKLDIYTSYGGSGVYNVSVTLAMKIPGTGGGRPFTWKTNDEGRVSGTIEDGVGTYSVVASIEGCREYRSEVVVNPANPTLSIELIPIPRVSIVVNNSAGVPLPGVDFRLVDKTRGKSLNEAAQKVSDNNGAGLIYLKDGYGSYALMANLDGYLPAGEILSLIEDPAKPGNFMFEREVTLYKAGENRPVNLTGTLVELGPGHDKAYKDGKKIPNAQIAFQSSDGTALPDILTTALRTGAEGEITAKKIPEGTYIVSISAEGYEAYTGPLKVAFGMEPVLLSLKLRNAAVDNWIKMILTEGWGDLSRSRQFHASGTKENPADGNVDYALAMSSLQAKNKENSIPAFALAASKVSKEKWWDRAIEGHIWNLMHHQDVGTAVSEIRRLTSSEYNNRAESDESRETAFMIGAAVGVMKGPWTGDSEEQGYVQLDAEVTASLKGTHLTSYEAGKRSVSEKYTELSQAEAKAKKDLMDAASADRERKLADLRRQIEKLQSDQNDNTVKQNAQNQKITDYRTTAEAAANNSNARLATLLQEATTLHAEITQLQNDQVNQNTGMQAQVNRRRQELQGGLDANIAGQNTEVNNFNNYYNNVEPQMTGYVNRMNAINAELVNLAARISNTPANVQTEMAGASMADLERVGDQINTNNNQLDNLSGDINAMEQSTNADINKLGANLQQQITDRQAAIQQQVNALNEGSPFCEECRRFAEQPPNCAECAVHRAQVQAQLARLEQAFYEETPQEVALRNQIENLENGYNNAVANYNANIQAINARDAELRAEYNRLAEMLNNPPAPKQNPEALELQRQDNLLRSEYEEKHQLWTNLDAGLQQEQSRHETRLKQLQQDEAKLRQQMDNVAVQDPQANPLIAQKNARYKKILADDEAERQKLAKVQEDYRLEGERYQQEIARLTGIATTLKNQIDTINAQMGNQPGSGTTPGVEGGTADSATLAFITYKDYPIEQRRQELLGWVTRSANIALPAAVR